MVREQLVISERSEGKGSLLPVSVHDIPPVSAFGLTPEKRGQQQPSKILAVYQRTGRACRTEGLTASARSAASRCQNTGDGQRFRASH